MSSNKFNGISVIGGKRLSGSIDISGSKNATLPIVVASILIQKNVCIKNVPNIADVHTMIELIRKLNIKTTLLETREGISLSIDSSTINQHKIDLKASTIRASILLAAPILHLTKSVDIPLPGGCKIGKRPIDLHLSLLTKMGASIKESEAGIQIKCKKLKGAIIDLRSKSVGATQQAILAGVLAEGTTIVKNAAIEPEIKSLIQFLSQCGAIIQKTETDKITITGVSSLSPSVYSIPADRMEAGTYAIAVAATKGKAMLRNANISLLPELSSIFKKVGIKMHDLNDGIEIECNDSIDLVDLSTGPHPAFPTDLQAPIAAMFCALGKDKQKCTITENLFENRFGHVQELQKMKADISFKGNQLFISSGKKLIGADIYGTDLRSSKAMIVAGLCAKGTSNVFKTHFLRRGYQDLVKKLSQLGAELKPFYASGN